MYIGDAFSMSSAALLCGTGGHLRRYRGFGDATYAAVAASGIRPTPLSRLRGCDLCRCRGFGDATSAAVAASGKTKRGAKTAAALLVFTPLLDSPPFLRQKRLWRDSGATLRDPALRPRRARTLRCVLDRGHSRAILALREDGL